MATRREAREWALQLLFQLDMNFEEPGKVFPEFWSGKDPDRKMREFAEELVSGVVQHRDEIDERLKKHAENWDIRRMGVVERNALRMAILEMVFRTDIPPVVSINEAVDLAKYFSTNESGKFVNGILDKLRKDIDRPARE